MNHSTNATNVTSVGGSGASVGGGGGGADNSQNDLLTAEWILAFLASGIVGGLVIFFGTLGAIAILDGLFRRCKRLRELRKARNQQREDAKRMARAFIIDSVVSRRCPHCGVIIIKDGGCAHMQCALCRSYFTWDTATVVTREEMGCTSERAAAVSAMEEWLAKHRQRRWRRWRQWPWSRPLNRPTCGICMERRVNTVLPCSHTVCRTCLVGIASAREPGQAIECPWCRAKLVDAPVAMA